MFHCILYQPEIPPNTGNIIRLCANMGIQLHLIRPLGFHLDDKRLKRAGLDYHEWADMQLHDSLDKYMNTFSPKRLFACSTKGQIYYSNIIYQQGDAFIFGPETRGLPSDVLATFSEQQIIKIPMKTTTRSLNLSNAVAIILYEAWRQINFI